MVSHRTQQLCKIEYCKNSCKHVIPQRLIYFNIKLYLTITTSKYATTRASYTFIKYFKISINPKFKLIYHKKYKNLNVIKKWKRREGAGAWVWGRKYWCWPWMPRCHWTSMLSRRSASKSLATREIFGSYASTSSLLWRGVTSCFLG